MVKQPLTDRQIIVLQFIRKFIIENEYAPTIREISTGIKVKSPSSAKRLVESLEDKGYIKREKFKSRAIKII